MIISFRFFVSFAFRFCVCSIHVRKQFGGAKHIANYKRMKNFCIKSSSLCANLIFISIRLLCRLNFRRSWRQRWSMEKYLSRQWNLDSLAHNATMNFIPSVRNAIHSMGKSTSFIESPSRPFNSSERSHCLQALWLSDDVFMALSDSFLFRLRSFRINLWMEMNTKQFDLIFVHLHRQADARFTWFRRCSLPHHLCVFPHRKFSQVIAIINQCFQHIFFGINLNWILFLSWPFIFPFTSNLNVPVESCFRVVCAMFLALCECEFVNRPNLDVRVNANVSLSCRDKSSFSALEIKFWISRESTEKSTSKRQTTK